ncbi:MAG: hypothetical protein M3Y78_06525 [Pseudomonadota bacterium]|nr:hypothetical protein [Pseudomonadota bacterium]
MDWTVIEKLAPSVPGSSGSSPRLISPTSLDTLIKGDEGFQAAPDERMILSTTMAVQ